jgi:hypothetical protein
VISNLKPQAGRTDTGCEQDVNKVTPEDRVKIMKKEPSNFWTSAPAVSPLMRPPSQNNGQATFPSYNAFFKRFLRQAKVRVPAFFPAVRLNVAFPFSPSLIVSGVI